MYKKHVPRNVIIVTARGIDVIISAPRTNMPPIVDAGSDLTITLPDNTVVLNGSVSDDGLPSGKLDVTWEVIPDSGNVVFGDIHQAMTTATFSEAGHYVLRLTASDSQLASSDEMSVDVGATMALAVPICGDQDGSELPLVGGCPDYLPFASTGIVQIPGSGVKNVVFDFVYRDAAYNNELGVITVDDINGSINGINPGDPSYLGLALQRAWVAFPSGSYPNSPDVTATFNSGDYLMFFLIQNGTLSDLLAYNPDNSLYGSPVAFFSITSLNPDGTDHLKMFIHKVTGLLQLAFEDSTGGGDNDFNDFVFNVLIPGL